jgi:hypothetical protein
MFFKLHIVINSFDTDKTRVFQMTLVYKYILKWENTFSYRC